MSHQSYDDMSPGSQVQEEDRKFNTMKRVVTGFMVFLILFAIGAIIFLVMTNEKFSKDAAEDLSGIVIEDDTDLTDLMDDIIETPSDITGTPIIKESESISEPIIENPVSEVTVSEPELVTPDKPEETIAVVTTPTGNTSSTEAEISNIPIAFTPYNVAPGDTVNKIAASFGLLPETIIGVNEIKHIDDIKAGMQLDIPDRDGKIYIVKEGDNLSMIAYGYGMGYVTLAEVNGLKSSLINIGQRLFIPDRTISTEAYQTVMNTFFTTPAAGPVVYKFNSSVEDIITGEKKVIDGIYIKNELGTDILAASTGTVMAVENNQSNLGRYIIIDHDNGYQTIYGHLDKLYVDVGISVEQGDKIGTMGLTGRILEPMLFFKITKEGIAIDPKEFF